MKVLVILGHQSPGSFNHGIVAAAVAELQAAGHEAIVHDLYQEKFDPILPSDEVPKTAQPEPCVWKHCQEVRTADGYIVVHPNWWGQPPAILKGWLDRVFRQGIAYEFGPSGLVQHLAGKRALVFTTSNTPRDMELELYGDPLENLWKNCIFGLCGVKDFARRNFESIVMSTPEHRRQWLDEVRQMVREKFPAQ